MSGQRIRPIWVFNASSRTFAKKSDSGTKSRNYEDRTPAPYGGFLGRFVIQTTNHGPISAPSQALSSVSPTRAPNMCR